MLHLLWIWISLLVLDASGGARTTKETRIISSSKVLVCQPPPNCTYIDSVDASIDVVRLHTLYLCEPGSLRTLDIRAMNKTAFLEEIVQTKRRRLCNSELTALENVLDGVRINKKLFKRHQRLPSFDSYDLLAATLLSLRPRKHSIRHEHAQSHLHTLGNKLRHNNYEVLYNTPAGAWLEFGVASGQSINVTAFMLERRNLTSMVPVYGFDSFLGLPVEWAGHMKKGAFSSGGTVPPVHEHVTILQGWFNTTLDPFLEHMQHCRASSGHSVLGINIDNDLYDGALMILRKLARCLKVGSVLHFHELYSTWDANNPMEELLALYDFMIENTVTLRLMPVMSSAQEAGVLSVLQIA